MVTCKTCGNRWILEDYDVEVSGDNKFGPSYVCPACGEVGDEEA